MNIAMRSAYKKFVTNKEMRRVMTEYLAEGYRIGGDRREEAVDLWVNWYRQDLDALVEIALGKYRIFDMKEDEIYV